MSFTDVSRAFVLINLFLNNQVDSQSTNPEVDTDNGRVMGTSQYTQDGRLYETYLGIPFAQPPINELRFRAPSQSEPWNGTWNGTYFRAECIQLFSYDRDNPVGSIVQDDEDCLYLNVYVPGGVDNINSSLPVMVWFHGGAFIIGGTEPYNAGELALHGGVIIVSAAYRVGPLGFLTTGDSAAPGNYGLGDAVEALRWVQQNIANFGGDTDRVTVFGQSAGGAVVSYLLYAPAARGLFHRCIALSGSSGGWWANSFLAEETSRDLGEFARCPINDSAQMVDCLREKDANALDIAGWITPILTGGYVPLWVPVTDRGDLVPGDPRDNMAEGLGSEYDLLLGTTYHDGASFVFANPLGDPDWPDSNFASSVALLRLFVRLTLLWWENVAQLVDEIFLRYPDMESEDLLTRTQAATQMLTDWTWASAAGYEAAAHARTADPSLHSTYLYEYSYHNTFLLWDEWVNGTHADDLYSLFGEQFNKEDQLGNWTEVDSAVSWNYMSYLTNFAHTGNPNDGPNDITEVWPVYDDVDKQFMVFGPRMEVTAQDQDRLDRYYFWNVVFPELAIPRTATKNIHKDTKFTWKETVSSIKACDGNSDCLMSFLESLIFS